MNKEKIIKSYINPFICLMLVMWLPLGCATVQQQYEQLTGKADDASGAEVGEKAVPAEEEKPLPSEKPQNLGVIVNIKQFLPVKSGPARDTKTLGKLYLGNVVTIDREQGHWAYVIHKDETGQTKLEGWVVKSYVEKLPSTAQTEGLPVGSEKFKNQGFVVDVKNELSVKSGPARETKTLGNLYLGDKVTIDKEQGRWCYVARVDEAATTRLEGWVVKRYIEALPADEQAAESLIDLAYMRGVGTSSSPDQDDKHKNMKTRTTVEGTVAGAAAGAALGAITAKLTGKSAGKGAALGAAGGAVVGFAAGSYVANQKEKYANDEEYLDAALEEAVRHNREAKERNITLGQVIAITEQEIEVIKSKIRDVGIRQQRAQVDIRTLKKISQETEQRIEVLQGLLDAQEKAIMDISEDTKHLKELQNEMQVTRRQIQDLKAKREELMELIGELAQTV